MNLRIRRFGDMIMNNKGSPKAYPIWRERVDYNGNLGCCSFSLLLWEFLCFYFFMNERSWQKGVFPLNSAEWKWDRKGKVLLFCKWSFALNNHIEAASTDCPLISCMYELLSFRVSNSRSHITSLNNGTKGSIVWIIKHYMMISYTRRQKWDDKLIEIKSPNWLPVAIFGLVFSSSFVAILGQTCLFMSSAAQIIKMI